MTATIAAMLAPAPTPLTLRPRQVGGRAVWHQLVRDGALVPLFGEDAYVVGTLNTPEQRAAALAPLIPAHSYIAGRSAAWVYCGGTPPARLDLAHRSGRNRPPVWAGANIWSAQGLSAHSNLIGGAWVTSPVRTTVDLAIREEPATAIPRIRELFALGVTPMTAAYHLSLRPRTQGRIRAYATLAAAGR